MTRIFKSEDDQRVPSLYKNNNYANTTVNIKKRWSNTNSHKYYSTLNLLCFGHLILFNHAQLYSFPSKLYANYIRSMFSIWDTILTFHTDQWSRTIEAMTFESVSDCCLTPIQQFFSYIMAEQVIYQWDNKEVRFVLDQHTVGFLQW